MNGNPPQNRGLTAIDGALPGGHETVERGFVEGNWIGTTLAIGEVALRIDGPCPRCIMTTLAQGSLPKDAEVLRTVVQRNHGNVGVYATVVRGGRVCRGDSVSQI